MRSLYLLRHAKSSWDDPSLSDHDRPLAPRGRRAVKLLAEYVEDERIAPDLVLCSSAQRARETLEGIESALGEAGAVEIEPDLYGASADDLLAGLREVPDDIGSVMLVGHNPAIQMLTLSLSGSGEQLESVGRKYPTGGLATLEFDGDWSALAPGAATLTAFVKPKQLG